MRTDRSPFGLVAHAIHGIALALWLGCVATSGLAAAIIFPTMKSLDPRLGEYASYTGDHWMLAAGHVAARIFAATDLAQVVGAAVAGITAACMVASRQADPRRAWSRAWLGCLVISGALLVVQVAWLRPTMDADLHRYWDHARAGDNAAAEGARAAFSRRHPTASNLMAGTAVCVLAALGLVVPACAPSVQARRADAGTADR